MALQAEVPTMQDGDAERVRVDVVVDVLLGLQVLRIEIKTQARKWQANEMAGINGAWL